MSVPRARLLDLMKVRFYPPIPCPFLPPYPPLLSPSGPFPTHPETSKLQAAANTSKAQCQVFATVYNPDGLRLGNKVLRQRLRGPALASYYPRRRVTVQDLNSVFGPEMETWDDAEQERLEHIEEYVFPGFPAHSLCDTMGLWIGSVGIWRLTGW